MSIVECLQESKEKLHSVLKEVELKAVDLIAEKNLPVVRQVADIPRLYRRTNRDMPAQPCSYVAALLTSVDELTKLNFRYTLQWIPSILSSITSM